ncbi:MAG TPA: hypothetical protein DEP00_08175 [Lachnospiraceae bacterium]|jgi:uncharacterized membrane protein|nr:hypothetical protein [Lachnospiraceae bacterium]
MSGYSNKTGSSFSDWFHRTFTHKSQWERYDLKNRARIGIMKNFGPCLVVALVLAVMTSWFYYLYDPMAILFSGWDTFRSVHQSRLITVVIMCLLTAFLFGPLEVGCRRFFIENERGQQADLKEIAYVFQNPNYLNQMLTMLVRNLLIFLGTVLFVVPGLYLSYSFRMVPYLLADQPGLKLTDALSLSNDMMKGQKWDAFLLDLSFWPWMLASMMTFGLAGLLYGWPYRQAAAAELYLELDREKYGG